MNGIGIYENDITYEGEYQDDKRTGYGIYYWTDGRIYKGGWSDGVQVKDSLLFEFMKISVRVRKERVA